MNQMNYQKKVKAIPTKGLIKDLINKFSALKGAKYFFSGIFQNYLVFMPTEKYQKKVIANITKSGSNLDHILLIIVYFQT